MRLLRALRARQGRQRGQVVIMVAGGMVAILGFVALSTDVGLYLRDMRDAQNDADAAALAGAQALTVKPPSGTTAKQRAEDWAEYNGADGQVIWTGDGDCGTTPSGGRIPWGVSDSNGDGDPDTICLGIQRSVSSMFARVLGIEHFDVKRRAAARAVHSAGGPVCPWALVATGPENPGDGTYFGIRPGVVYTFKPEYASGNWGRLDLGFTGTSGYKALLESGCAPLPSGLNIFMEGQSVVTNPQPGNYGPSTRDALNEYYQYELTDGVHDGQGYTWCDVAFTPDPLSPGQTGVPTGYNPATGPTRQGCGTDAANGGKGRWSWIPIVDKFPSGSSDTLKILGVAAIYLVRWDRTGPPGHTQVYAMFSTSARFKPKDLFGLSNNPLAPMRIVLIK